MPSTAATIWNGSSATTSPRMASSIACWSTRRSSCARPQVWQLSEVVDALHVPVLCFGLRTDFRGELFEGSQYLLAWADEIDEIKTICHSGKKATMTVRVDEAGHAVQQGPQVEIGGNERYVSVSRAEFKKVMRGESTVDGAAGAEAAAVALIVARVSRNCRGSW